MSNILPTFEDYQRLTILWACDRGIVPNAKAHTQLLKAVSELGELCDAENKGKLADIKDGVGDVLACLINYCAVRQIDPVQCLGLAYNEIKDRKGYLTPEGVFVKETNA